MTYERFRPRGAGRSTLAIRVKTRDPDGQVVAVSGRAIGHADGACGLGGNERGDAVTWRIPARLARGRHQLRITAESSSCDGRDIVESTTARFRLQVEGPRG